MPLPAVAEQLVFVTSTTTDNADFPGLAGGDAICADAASSAGLAGVWAAWLSSDEIDAADRLIGNGPFRRIDGVEIAANRAALLDGTLDASSGLTCMGWTLNSGSLGTTGLADRTDFRWTSNATGGCGNSATRIYCFQQGNAVPVRAPLLAVGPALGAVVLALLLGGWIELRDENTRCGVWFWDMSSRTGASSI